MSYALSALNLSSRDGFSHFATAGLASPPTEEDLTGFAAVPRGSRALISGRAGGAVGSGRPLTLGYRGRGAALV